jgi:hypothetical protein
MNDVNDRTAGLLAWQWAQYPQAHADRANLLLHALTVPLFLGGTVAILAAPALGVAWAAGGLGGMVAAIALQGRGHKRERVPPAPFRGPLDVVARIAVEQWITFPRFVLSGAFGRAWRSAATRPSGSRARE